MKNGKILIVDDNEDILFALNLLLEPHLEEVRVTTDPERIGHFMSRYPPDVVLLDMNFRRDASSGREGFHYLEEILKLDPDAVVVFMTAYADTGKAVEAIKAGAVDFVPKPWEKEKLLATLSSAIALRRSRRRVEDLQQQVAVLGTPPAVAVQEIIGRSAAMQELFATIEKLSDTDASILITGENGTGKDLVARAVYRGSPRAGGVFVPIDLGSIPESLFESELFGHEKGAFTDAKKEKPGRLEVAAGGTLFLDEIGNLSLSMQAKLLTAIEKREIVRLGATRPVPIDVRLISATNADIREMIAAGRFRPDLLYRINTIELHIPPLRERGDDVILLAEHFLDRFGKKYRKTPGGLAREVKAKLLKYPWPGNVRELEHAVERAVILSGGGELRPEHFMLTPGTPARRPLDDLNLDKLEHDAIEQALRRAGGNVSRAAELLGITRYALYRKMEKKR
jgi:DNA-binding NtrC family response regulator